MSMKFKINVLTITILLISFSVFGHDTGETLKIECFIGEYKVSHSNPPWSPCYEDNHPQTKNKNEALTWCKARLQINYSSGSHNLENLRTGRTVDVRVDITFKDGTKHSSINKALINLPKFEVTIGSDKMLNFYRREEPNSIECKIL